MQLLLGKEAIPLRAAVDLFEKVATKQGMPIGEDG